ncbi:hypothetical protein MTR67_017487 [Solanum verrucosum]|uniref:FBD domain-containing protein n=2 Tax=Solanum TaxID=4107 RepID=A0AAF0QI15_SOLVR|nr:hypothetical protein MTR67_017487 [Solanum verrucosum]
MTQGVHLSTYAYIDRWMLYVTRNGVKKLKLNMTKDGVVPKRLPCTLNCLWHLDLDVNFNKLGQTSYTLELIKSFPNLRELEIWDKTTDDIVEGVMKYLDTPACLDKTLNKLEDVSIHSFNYSKVVLSFVKLLFAHGSSLSRMSIYPDKASSSKEELNVATELMRFPRVSPKAELIYHQMKSWIKGRMMLLYSQRILLKKEISWRNMLTLVVPLLNMLLQQ